MQLTYTEYQAAHSTTTIHSAIVATLSFFVATSIAITFAGAFTALAI